jgi:malate dehydrogenase (oxaloacetate-decarboxylating)
LINACKVTGKRFEELDIVIAGAGAAWTAIAHLLAHYGATQIATLDSKWALCSSRDNLNKYKKELLAYNKKDCSGGLDEVIQWADIFIGVSKPDILTTAHVQSMWDDPIIFALSNPNSEITEVDAKAWWAKIYAAWRSDVPVQINNILVFPWLIKWALEARIEEVTMDHKQAVWVALADMVSSPAVDLLLPDPFDPKVVETVVKVMKK